MDSQEFFKTLALKAPQPYGVLLGLLLSRANPQQLQVLHTLISQLGLGFLTRDCDRMGSAVIKLFGLFGITDEMLLRILTNDDNAQLAREQNNGDIRHADQS